MDKQQVQQFRQRWQAVEAIQQAEMRQATFELRWKQLNAIYCMAQQMNLTKPLHDDLVIYQRWAKLKEHAEQHRIT